MQLDEAAAIYQCIYAARCEGIEAKADSEGIPETLPEAAYPEPMGTIKKSDSK
jgi:hypothetical protein